MFAQRAARASCLEKFAIIGAALLHLTTAAWNPLPPISVLASNNFLGDDGQWSPVGVRVGTPEQWLYMFPATVSQETWVVGPGGCDGTSACRQIRGGIFTPDQSSTFHDLGYYQLGADVELSNSTQADYGLYGLDTIAFNDYAVVPGQIVSVINTTDYLTGQLGLGVQLTRFNGTSNDLTLLSSLVQNANLIPSHSYGYTAGAAYRLKGVPASLTLGGFDASRFTPNDFSFSLTSSYAPALAVNSISVSSAANGLPSNWNTNPYELLGSTQAETFTIDTSTPFLWMPEAVCENFAQALNLTYNSTLQLYVFKNNTTPDTLANLNLTFTFNVADTPGSTNNLALTLPYAAFNLQLSYPFPRLGGSYGDAAVPYFPLRKATDQSQYIIGRAFLQETYLTVDYERNKFTLSQATFTIQTVSDIELFSINRNPDSIFPGPHDGSAAMPTGTKIGIAVAAVLGILIVAFLVWFFAFRRRKPKGTENLEKPHRRSFLSRVLRLATSNTTVSELLGDRRHPTEVAADSSNSRFELAGSTPIEMPAAEVSPSFYQPRDSQGSSPGVTLRNDPRTPAEMAQRQSLMKSLEATADAAASDRSASPVPPYSPENMDQRVSASVSRYSARHSQAFGTPSSGEQGISPVGRSSGNGSNQNSTSNSIRSPVSPVATMPRGQRLTGPVSEDSASPTSNGSGPWLRPIEPARAPSQSSSRGSRSHQERLNTTSDQADEHRDSRSSRFSWE